MKLLGLTRSLAPRFTLAILLVAFFSLLLLTAAAIIKFDQGLAIQDAELARLSSRKLAERLDGDARLAKARLEQLFESRVAKLGDMSRLADVQKAVLSGNGVAMAEMLTPLRASADIDGIIVVNSTGQVIGSDTMKTDLRLTNIALAAHPLFEKLGQLLAHNDREAVSVQKDITPLHNKALQVAIGATGDADVALIAVYPVFDEFGDVAGALVGHRALRAKEKQLQQFSGLSGIGVALFQGATIVSSAGLASDLQIILTNHDEFLKADQSGKLVARCIDYELATRLCTLLPMTELSALRQDMVRSGNAQGKSLISWFMGLSVLIFFIFGVTAAAVSRAIVGPLSAITAAILALTRGDWKAEVPGQARSDEVGDIARSLLLLQKSVEERDRLRDERVLQNQRLVMQDQKLLLQNLQFTAALENMGHGLCMLDSRQRVAVLNDQFRRMFGIKGTDSVVGITALQMRKAIPDPVARTNFVNLARQYLGELEVRKSAAFSVEFPDGRTIAVTHQVMDDGGSVATFADITDRRRDEARLSYLARHDSLTDLANRSTLTERLTQALAMRHEDEIVAVHFLDLDRFKALNDTLGHGAGDRVLRQVSSRMKKCLTSLDTIARFGGDEFVIVQTGIKTFDEVEALAFALISKIGEACTVEGRLIDIGATIGIATAPAHDSDPEGLLKQADLALYRAKRLNRGAFLFYDREMDTHELARRALEMDLKAACDSNAFSLAYQPIVEASTGQLNGFEALIRWQHPTRGNVPPAEFIQVAEEIGLIGRIGNWVLRKACDDAAAWPAHLTIAVNVSPLQIKAGGLELVVAGALGASGLSASRLHLEITESLILERNEQSLAVLHNLHKLGVAFSMDDFGTGYSSLSSLSGFPFDTLKIDRSFVADLAQKSENRHIIEATCSLARKLNISCLAEGVETREQIDFLIACGCDELQGYYFGKPMVLADAWQLINKYMDHGNEATIQPAVAA